MVAIAIGNATRTAWILGYPDKARERMAELTAFAGENKSPFNLAFSLLWESFLLCQLGEPQRTEIAATQALVISEEHDFASIRNQARVMIRWARVQLGSAEEGVALIRRGSAGNTESGARIVITDNLTRLAQLRPSTVGATKRSAQSRRLSRRIPTRLSSAPMY